MANTIPGLLNDTLNLVSLARETALVLGKDAQVKKLTPVVDELRTVVTSSKKPASQTEPTDLMAQSDFRVLLDLAKNTIPAERRIPTIAIGERNIIVKAMAEGNMSDVDIARQLGMTRDEVHLVLNIGKVSSVYTEVK